jgi:hypothetical protein
MNKYDSNMKPFSEASFRYNDFLLDYCQTTTPALSGCENMFSEKNYYL